MASFFSTHRPLSITGPVPAESSIEAIDKIFQPRPRTKLRAPSQDIIFTLSSAVENLDEQIASKRAEPHAQGAEQKAAIIKALMQRNDGSVESNRTHHLDSAPQSINVAGGNVKLAIQEIARRFRPFNAPPAPTPISDAEIDAAEAEAAAAEAGEEMQAKVFEVEIEHQDYDPYIQQVVLNVHQQSDLDNGNFFTSHEARIVEMGETAMEQEIEDLSYGRRLGGRTRRGSGMYAISVKRQRRLKMKKHKYKKLMRKTRNLRRRLGQI